MLLIILCNILKIIHLNYQKILHKKIKKKSLLIKLKKLLKNIIKKIKQYLKCLKKNFLKKENQSRLLLLKQTENK